MVQRQSTVWLDAWYGKRKWIFLLLPLMWLFRFITIARRFYLQHFCQQQLPVPIIVVGNISVGGTGKTPLLIALVEHLQNQGYQPGVISRGYGGHAPQYPFMLSASSTAQQSGDEPLDIFQRTGCKVCVDADRVAAARALIREGCNILLSDDGLQHYRLGRSLEIAVIDGQRGFGNGFCLPVGPLREPVSRLKNVDFVIANSVEKPTALDNPAHVSDPLTGLNYPQPYHMTIEPLAWRSVQNDQSFPLDYFSGGTHVHALAGIGNPRRFFNTLVEMQLQPIEHEFPDHYRYQATDLNFSEPLPIVMTAKDAVKCRAFAHPDWRYLTVGAHLPEKFWQAFDAKIATITGVNK